MSYQERRSIVNVISTILITVLYASYMLQRYPQADPYAPEIFHYWGSFFLILIPVTIVAKIVIYIIFEIINTIATREEPTGLTDERDKIIELKANRNGFYAFVFGFVLAMLALVASMPPATMFVILVASGVVSEIIGDVSQFVFYRRGV